MCVMEVGGVGRGHDIWEITAYLGQLGLLVATNKLEAEFCICCNL